MILHPDKLLNYSDATKTFQCLVTAFERITCPELYLEEFYTKSKKISRSNEGCFRTYIGCPRCKIEWKYQIDGNPD